MNVLPAGQLVSVGTCRIRKNKEIKGGLNEKDIPKSFVKYFLYSTLSSIKLTSEAHFKVVTQHFFQKKFRNCSRKIKRVLELQPFQSCNATVLPEKNQKLLEKDQKSSRTSAISKFLSVLVLVSGLAKVLEIYALQLVQK